MGAAQRILDRIEHATKKINAVVNFLCVVFLTLQILTILLMSVGRYVLRTVPIWTEQFALFCLVWFAMMSISLSEKDDSHIRMELVDYIVPKKALPLFEYFSYIVVFGFSIYMIFNGIFLMDLSKDVHMSGMKISEAFLYLSLPLSGICTAYMALYRIFRKILGGNNVA